VIDRNGNGLIDDITEMFQNAANDNDFEMEKAVQRNNKYLFTLIFKNYYKTIRIILSKHHALIEKRVERPGCYWDGNRSVPECQS